MKKIIICMVLLLGGVAVTPFASQVYATETSACSQGVNVKVVGFKTLRGGATIKTTTTATVEDTDNGLKVYFKGDGPYNVRTSDRSGFDYMFKVGEWSYYFNY